MTLAEFKAWFEGFTEYVEGVPNEKQWKRIKARVKEIDGVPVTKTVFVERYVTPYVPYRPYWSSLDVCSSGNTAFGVSAVGKTATSANQFDGATAMLELGKAEYSEMLNS